MGGLKECEPLSSHATQAEIVYLDRLGAYT